MRIGFVCGCFATVFAIFACFAFQLTAQEPSVDEANFDASTQAGRLRYNLLSLFTQLAPRRRPRCK